MKLRKIIVAAGMIGGAVAGYESMMSYFFKYAMQTDMHNVTNKSLSNKGFEAKMSRGKSWLHKNETKTVEIRSYDDLRLIAHYFENKKAVRNVILVHGWCGRWDWDFNAIAKWLYEQDCNLLIIEQRAQGDSEGNHMTFGNKEKKDVASWAHYIAENSTLPIYLFGVSMGASTVIMATDENLPDTVKGIIADSGFTKPMEMLYNYGKKLYNIPKHPLMESFNLRSRLITGVDMKKYSTLTSLKYNKIPVQFIHGLDDDFVPPHMTLENYEACNAPKELLLVKDAKHIQSSLVSPGLYRSTLLLFFTKYH